MKYRIGDALSGLGRLFFPELCEHCSHELKGGEQVLCLSCILQLPRTGYHLHDDNRAFQNFTGRVPIEKATSFVYFTKQGMMQHLLHRLKYKGRSGIAHYLGRLMGEELKKSGWLDTIDGIAPVPLHKSKMRRRGFNQATLLAEGIAAATGLPVWEHLLIRQQPTESQTRKSRAERVENVRDAFRLATTPAIAYKHVLLIDDVLTTGATLEACAMALRQAAGVQISIATLALATD